MEVIFYILPRLIFLILLQLLWDYCLHKEYKNIDKQIEDIRAENTRLFNGCYEKSENVEECGKQCILYEKCIQVKEGKNIV